MQWEILKYLKIFHSLVTVCFFVVLSVSVRVSSPVCTWRAASQEAAQWAGKPPLSHLWKCELHRPERWVSLIIRFLFHSSDIRFKYRIIKSYWSSLFVCCFGPQRRCAPDVKRLYWLLRDMLSTTGNFIFLSLFIFSSTDISK